jgi:hypothetical protein
MPATVMVAFVSLGLTVFVHLAAVLVWGATLNQRVRQLERETERLGPVLERVAKLEASDR